MKYTFLPFLVIPFIYGSEPSFFLEDAVVLDYEDFVLVDSSQPTYSDIDPSNAETVESYNLQSKLPASEKDKSLSFELWLNSIEKYYAGRKKENIQLLAIGSGNGVDADFLASKGFSIERTDAAQGFVDLQKKSGHKATLFNILTDEFPQPYDMIIMPTVLNEIEVKNWPLVIEKIKKILRPNDALALSFIYRNDTLTTETITKKNCGRFHFHYMEQPEIIAFLNKMNLAIVSTSERLGIIGFIARKKLEGPLTLHTGHRN